MMSSTVAVQMKGLGFWFQACINSSIASFKSGTLTKLPRRIADSACPADALREYLSGDYLILYTEVESMLYLPSIRHRSTAALSVLRETN